MIPGHLETVTGIDTPPDASDTWPVPALLTPQNVRGPANSPSYSFSSPAAPLQTGEELFARSAVERGNILQRTEQRDENCHRKNPNL